MYFAKNEEGTIDHAKDKVQNNLKYGEIPAYPLETMAAFVDDVCTCTCV